VVPPVLYGVYPPTFMRQVNICGHLPGLGSSHDDVYPFVNWPYKLSLSVGG